MVAEKTYDVAIIADGMDGLAAAALLASRGFSCAVVCENRHPACLHETVRDEGFTFDPGLISDYLICPSTVKMLAQLGIRARLIESSPPLFFNDNRLMPIPSGASQVIFSKLVAGKTKLAWFRTLQNIRSIQKLPDKHTRPIPAAIPSNIRDTSDLLDLFSLLSAVALDTQDIDKISVDTFCRTALDSAHRHPGIPLGGFSALFSEIKNIITSKGSTVISAKAISITGDTTRATGVLIENGTIHASNVIAAVPVPRALELVTPDSVLPAARNAIDLLTPNGAVLLHLALDSRVTDLKSPIITVDPFTRGMVVSNLEPVLAPRGRQLISWMVPTEIARFSEPNFLEISAREIKDIIELIFPGTLNRIVCEKVFTIKPLSGSTSFIHLPTEKRLPMHAFRQSNVFLLNDAVNRAGVKFEPSCKAASKAVGLIEQSVNKS